MSYPKLNFKKTAILKFYHFHHFLLDANEIIIKITIYEQYYFIIANITINLSPLHHNHLCLTLFLLLQFFIIILIIRC